MTKDKSGFTAWQFVLLTTLAVAVMALLITLKVLK